MLAYHPYAQNYGCDKTAEKCQAAFPDFKHIKRMLCEIAQIGEDKIEPGPDNSTQQNIKCEVTDCLHIQTHAPGLARCQKQPERKPECDQKSVGLD